VKAPYLESSKGKEASRVMEFFLPSILLMLLAFFATIYILPQFTPVILASGAFVFLGLAAYNHYTTFAGEYNIMQWADSAKQIAPTLLTGLVIVLMGGYIIYMFGGGVAPRLPTPPYNIPPPSTATNVLTEGIGNGLAAVGMPVSNNRNSNANVPPIANNAHKNVAASVLSAGV